MGDRTLRDIGRRELSLTGSLVSDVLPDYFKEDNPTIVTFLEKYYNTLDSDHSFSDAGEQVFSQRQYVANGGGTDLSVGSVPYTWDSDRNFGYQLKNLPTLRDIQQTDKENLTFIEDELLLGQNFIEGTLDPTSIRTGSELSNNFYRSKGTKFGIERFFNLFHPDVVDPEIVYGKNLVMKVGDKIGPESGLYITDDKIYQFWGILIKIGKSTSEWLDLYKLFAHPGGMYVAGEVVIEGKNIDISFDEMITDEAVNNPPTFEGRAFFAPNAMLSASGIVGANSKLFDSESPPTLANPRGTPGGSYRIDLDKSKIADFTTIGGTDVDNNHQGTLRGLDNMFGSIVDVVRINSQTMDADSSRGVLRFSADQITIDAGDFPYYVDSSRD